jgi:glycosyltransferase involved in cell wall biosynthesis
MKSPSISFALIVKDDAENIDGFFETIAPLADELVVAYSPSADATLSKLEAWKGKVAYPVIIEEHSEKPFHYGSARNSLIDLASKEYVFMLDTDERLTKDTCDRLKGFLADKHPDVVSMQREDEITPHLIDPQTRIIRKSSGIRYATDKAGRLHEHLELTGEPAWFDGLLLHKQGKNHWIYRHDRFFILLAKEVDRAENTKGLFREVLRAFAGFFYKFRKEYFRKKTYLDGKAGFKYSFIRGLHSFLFHLFVGLKPRVESHDKNNN